MFPLAQRPRENVQHLPGAVGRAVLIPIPDPFESGGKEKVGKLSGAGPGRRRCSVLAMSVELALFFRTPRLGSLPCFFLDCSAPRGELRGRGLGGLREKGLGAAGGSLVVTKGSFGGTSGRK